MTHVLDLKGVIPPMITPLTASGVVDGAAVDRLVNHMLVNNCAGIFVLGSSGEGPWLTTDQRKQLVTDAVRAVSGRVQLLVGVLEPSTGRTLETLHIIEELGADAVVIASPYYFAADALAQSRHFEQVAAATKLPIVLYNIPSMTHNPIAVETVREALQFDNVIGLKDSAANMDEFERFLALREARPNFRVFQGAERLAVQSLLAGPMVWYRVWEILFHSGLCKFMMPCAPETKPRPAQRRPRLTSFGRCTATITSWFV